MPKQSKYQPLVDLLENLEQFLESANEPDAEDEPDEEPEPKSKPAKPAGKKKPVEDEPDDDDAEEGSDDDDDAEGDADADGDDDGDEEEVVTQKDLQAVVKKIIAKGGAERFQKILTKYKLKTLQAAKASQLPDLLDELNKVLKAVSAK